MRKHSEHPEEPTADCPCSAASAASATSRAQEEAPGEDIRAKLMGLGESSTRKSYYPELKRRLEELERFRALLDQSSDTIFLVDGTDGHVIDVTGSAEAIGLSRERLVGRKIDSLLTSRGASRLRRVLVRGGGIVHLDDDARMVADGRESPPLEASVRVVGVGGQKYAMISCRDVSAQVEARREIEKARDELERRVEERTRELTVANLLLHEAVRKHKRAEERYRRAKEQAEEANRAKTEFLSVVSHELRTPLTAVRGFTQIIAKQLEKNIFPLLPGDDGKLARTMQHMRENLVIVNLESQRLSGLINDLLDIAKLESGRVDFAREPVNIAHVLEHAVLATESIFQEAGIPLVLSVAQDMPPVLGDYDRLIQVVVNLLSNAVKFCDDKEVRCEGWVGREHILVCVTDSGPGIAEEYQEKIFEKFVQAGDSLTGRPKGTGLGLAISRQIVERHGGHIWVESQPGAGSSFCFNLPVIAPPAAHDGGDGNGDHQEPV
ncbi:PAS/PAC sensor signal transduction histidine kinase [Desulfovibrio sp. X2]|uniref:PAS domain-containing sensor histidine kinase n=1 Tax=Desulfovibrio sp. X2 TaxID=941449 RepID=UPI0003589635|nr:PAS domain-containing sensor histidine kinase [Desulfovibrio sp. X2]EPR40777.1 PAS/PAC sensor signal transduction histidine kinase [Desulfovibrio sp. X2]